MSNAGFYIAGAVFIGLGLALSIGLHELGHMVPAKRFGVKVPRFMIGFGPTVFSRKRGETEYGVKLIPLGGYVSLLGMAPPAEEYTDRPAPKNGLARAYLRYTERFRAASDLPADEQHRAFYRLTAGRKLIVMAGGPVANLILGVVFSAIVLCGFGVMSPSNQISQVVACAPISAKPLVLDTSAGCGSAPQTIAAAANLRAGDRIESIGTVSVANPDEVRAAMVSQLGQTATFKVLRDGQHIAFTAKIENQKVYNTQTQRLETRPFFGAVFDYQRKPLGVTELAVFSGKNIAGTFAMLVDLPQQALHAIGAIEGTEQRSSSGAVSVVGIAKVAGDLAIENQGDWIGIISMWLLTLASLNFALFAFNMIPVLPLDGGHILAALFGKAKAVWFKVRGRGTPRPVDLTLLAPLTMVGWGILTLMGLLFVVADIVAPMHL